MKNLTELVRQYKRTNSTVLLGEIFGMLDSNIHKRAEYLFYQQKYNIGKKWVKLVELKRMELDDVIQDLRLQILELIARYDVKKPFENYLYSTLQFWFPKCLRNRDSKATIGTFTESEMTHNENDDSIFNHLTVPAVYPADAFDSSEYFDDLSEMENKVVNLFLECPDKTQTEVAETLGVTQQRVSELIANIRAKYNRPL